MSHEKMPPEYGVSDYEMIGRRRSSWEMWRVFNTAKNMVLFNDLHQKLNLEDDVDRRIFNLSLAERIARDEISRVSTKLANKSFSKKIRVPLTIVFVKYYEGRREKLTQASEVISSSRSTLIGRFVQSDEGRQRAGYIERAASNLFAIAQEYGQRSLDGSSILLDNFILDDCAKGWRGKIHGLG